MTEVERDGMGVAAPEGAKGSQLGSRRKPPRVAIGFLLLVVIVAVFAPIMSPYDPIQNDLTATMQPPAWVDDGSTDHLLGTDRYGRDVLTRLMYGARSSLVVVALSLLIAVVIGGSVGIIAGYAGGLVDAALSRLTDIMLSIPSILVALAVSVALGPSLRNVILILGFLAWPNIARLIRGEALAMRVQGFVGYARTIGVRRRSILWRHILPNVLPTLMVTATLEVANIILSEAGLSFLGAGVPPPTPSWGAMVEEGSALVATGWWIALFPGLAIFGTVLAFNTFGDWVRDVLDPSTMHV